MAGNLVKWWKHKILGGYKQFSVQECTTDSEELMYHQVRASSSCSAPPDLLLVSDRENNMPLRSPVVNIIAATTTTAPATTTTSPSSGINACHITSAANNNQQRYQQHQHHQQQQQQKLQHHHHHHQQQQQQQHHQHQITTQQLSLAYNNGCKDIIGNTGGGINAAGGTGSSGGGGGGGSKHQKQSVVVVASGSTSKHGHQQQHQQQTPDMQPSLVTHDIVDGQPLDAQTPHNHSSTKQTHHHTQQQQQHHNHNHNTHHQQPQRSEEHIRLEEFTCDVSVEGGKSSQPLQFSFTFYDLDGHHGKITKDDIVGIVYTIYESIGKSVVVPHSGSKTINVRLTVSPEGKTKATKNAKKSLDHHSLNLNQKPTATAAALASNNTQATRRLHRYRPRKLIKSDEEDDDSNSDKERDLNLSHILAHKAASKAYKLGKQLKTSEQHCCSQQHQQQHHQQHHQQPALNDLPNSPLDSTAAIYDNLKASSPLEACRECLAAAADETRNVAGTSPLVTAATTTATTTTSPAQFPAASSSKTTNEAYMKHVASTRIKMLRKSRKQKHQDCLETRQRSLSVGNETCWKNRHLQAKHSNSSNSNSTQQQLLWQAEQHINNSVVVGGNSNANGNGIDMVDGVQLRNPLKNTKSMMASSSSTSAHKRNSAECWKTALNRNDLISIIRESMEKNRLCFQLNGKPQANVSPIRQQTNTNTNNPHQQTQPHNPQVASSSSKHSHQQQQQVQQRQRSNTVSKIPTLIANHNNIQSATISPQHHHHPQRSSSCANTISNCNNHSHSHSHDTSLANEPYSHTNSSNSSNNHHYHHHQPHIPIYHQQMAINPAVIAAQNALLTATASGNVGGSSLLQQHGKMNLCGYDSFLHATICGGGLSHSPPPPAPPSASAPAPLPAQTSSTNHSPLNTQITISSNTNNLSQHQQQQQQQQIATVQPIMAQNTASTSKHLSLAVTPQQQQLKSGKILRQTFNSTSSQQQQQHHHSYTNTTQNSPQYHGYQRLPSSSKHNLSALHLLSPNTEKPSLSELDKWRRDQVKTYDQLLYAKLSEKLQQTNLVSSSASNARDCNQRRKQQRVTRQRRTTALQLDSQAITAANDSKLSNNSICLRAPPPSSTISIVGGDPLECENLLGQTSDEDINSPQDIINPLQLNQTNENRQVAEATLVDIDKITDELTAQKANLTVNVDTLLSVGVVSETDEVVVHNLHNSLHENDLEIDEDLEEDDEEEEEEEIDEELEDEDMGQIVESGRNSNNSNHSGSNANTANTNTSTNNGANNSSTTSSLIHRYVHEHIHHHYHHFEEKEE